MWKQSDDEILTIYLDNSKLLLRQSETCTYNIKFSHKTRVQEDVTLLINCKNVRWVKIYVSLCLEFKMKFILKQFNYACGNY